MSSSKRLATTSNKDNSAVICFIAGVTAVLMGYSVYSHLKTLHERNTLPKKTTNKTGAKLEDSIPLKSLAYLTQSHNVNIQSSSIKIILERAMSGMYLPKIIAACDKNQSIEIKSKALPSLQLLTRKENNKAALLEAGALGVLVDALKCTDPDMKEVTQRYVAVAICDLIQGSDINKYCILELGVLDPIKRILTSDEIRNNELKYWTLMILYQISLSDPLPKVLIENGFVSLLARMARMTYGNTNMPKFCMQSLVRIAANVDVSEAKKVLTELLEYDIVDLISNCLRGDDVELIYWAAGLMHEFVLKDVAADKFREIKGIHVILAGLLSAEEMYISRVILRTIKFMAYGQDKFRHEMVRSGMVKKIMHCLSLDDEDVRYWAILCIHVVAGQVESHEDILTAQEFEILLELALSTKIKVAIFVSDILSLICCISSNNTFIEPNLNLIVKTLNSLLIEGELDVQYNAAGAIFNIMTMTFAFASKVRDTCFETLLLMSTSATHERVQLTCTKGALMVVIKNRFLVPQINDQATEPLMETINTLSGLILPIMMTQTIARATKKELRKTKASFSGSSYSNVEDREVADLPVLGIVSLEEEETDEGEMDRLLLAPDYIDVSEQGTISNASRLDRVLKDRERSKYKKNKQSSKERMDAMTRDDISYLFNPDMSNAERESLFLKFEVPESARNQISGALTALTVLMENEQITDSIISGESYKNPILNVLDDIVFDIDDIDNSIYNRGRTKGRHGISSALGSTRSNLITTGMTSDVIGLRLSERIRSLVHHLVCIALYPALVPWASENYQNYPINTLAESKATEIYADVIEWICEFSKLPSHDKVPANSTNVNLGEKQGKSMFYKSMQTTNESEYDKRSQHRFSSRRHSDSSSDSEDDFDSDEGNELVSVYPMESKGDVPSTDTDGKNEYSNADDVLIVASTSEYYLGFSSRALMLLNSLLKYASVKQYLVQKFHFISILTYLLESQSSLTDRVMICLGGLFTGEHSIPIPKSLFQVVSILLWRNMHDSVMKKKQSNLFYSRLVLSYCSQHVTSDPEHNSPTNSFAFIELDLVSRSKYCIINHENNLQVRNDTWTFETVRATHCVPPVAERNDNEDEEDCVLHKYAYEVKLESDGLMQIGWVNDNFEFDAEGGNGVGDDTHSYGYDGNRSKKWHGKYCSMRTSYGLKWAEGDIITCAIDMDVGEIRYYKNGEDMGVAFYGVLVSCAWYPAISLSTGEQCKFQFGGAIDPLRYLPEGYTPISALALNESVYVKLPPPHFTKASTTNESEESDIAELANAMENMSVHSPVFPDEDSGNAEPNLRPVDGGLSVKPKVFSEHMSDKDRHFLKQQSQNSSLFVTELDPREQRYLPSLYFEVKIELLQKEAELSPSENLVSFGFKSLSLDGSFHFLYDRQKKCCTLIMDFHHSETFPVTIKNGDTVGVIYINETNTIGMTWNGKIKALVYRDKGLKSVPYLPFITGYVRSEINYGEEPLAWKSADSASSKQHVYNYLRKILGNRTMEKAL